MYTLYFNAVFQMKVIEQLRPQNVDSDSDSSSAPSEDLQLAHQKKLKLQVSDDTHKEVLQGDQHRERDAISIQKQHQRFMEMQMKKAEQYIKREQELPTVSSKLSVEDSASGHSCRPGMEGKGPRIVPQPVKNYRKRLKKKRNKIKQSTLNSSTIERT